MTFRQPIISNVGRRNTNNVQSQLGPNLSVTTLVGQDAMPSMSTGLPNPTPKPPDIRGFVSGFNINLQGTGASPPPNTTYDRPNPVLRKYSDYYTFTQNTSPELQNIVFVPPINQSDWPNPTLRTVQRQSFTPPQALTITTFVPPVVIPVNTQKYFFADVGTMMSR